MTVAGLPLTPTLSPSAGERENRSPSHQISSQFGRLSHGFLSKGCTREFMSRAGKTIAVAAWSANQVRPIARDEITHARSVAVAA